MKLLARILLWIGLAAVLLIGAVEAVMWIFFPAPRVAQVFEFENQIHGLSEKVSFEIDQKYARRWAPEHSGGGKEIHIVCLGGSATTAVLQNAQETWWGQTAAKLKKEFPESRFHVTTLAVEHRGILYGAKWAEEHLPQLRPDLVIAMYGFDDILLHPANYQYDPNKITKLKLDGQRRGKLKTFLVKVSQICRRISYARQRYALADKLRVLREKNYFSKFLRTERAIYPQLPVKYEVKREEGGDPVAEYLDGLRLLSAAAKKAGASLCIIGEPTLNTGLMGAVEERMVHRWWVFDPKQGNKGVVRVDPGGIEMELNRYQRAAARFCQDQGIPFVNLHGKLAPKLENFVDDVILTNLGAAAAADLILPAVQPLVKSKL
ncbi:MAG: hypothetical protein ACR2OZ_05030 [Verrucomicrobiales bacterium]